MQLLQAARKTSASDDACARELLDTVPIVPPLDLPILPLVYEQTADISGTLWEKTPQGEWRLRASFAGIGFKEFTSLTTVSRSEGAGRQGQ